MIFGVSPISGRFERKALLWLCTLGLFLLHAFSAGPLQASEVPCPPWDPLSQQQITQSAIPKELGRVLAYHKGNGLFAKFEEEKKVLLLQRPLKSSGELAFLPHRGMYRKLKTPFEQELLITMTAVHERYHSGKVESMALRNVPLAMVLVEGFFTVFSGSWESLTPHFQIYFASENQLWRLGLKPVHTVMQQMISCIILEGEQERLVTLFIRETNGDVTRDQFLDPQILTPDQWGDYQRYFDWGMDTRP